VHRETVSGETLLSLAGNKSVINYVTLPSLYHKLNTRAHTYQWSDALLNLQ